MTTLMLITGLLFVTSTLYSLWLESLKKSYEPDWTWATVVGGNTMIGVAYLACQLTVPMAGIDAFLLLLGLNITAGTPIVLWQLWQMNQRYRMRKEHLRGTTPPWGKKLD